MSENPEEQPSTGVLGRIGSWFSPWRAKGPSNPPENASSTSDRAVKSQGDGEKEESVRPETTGEQQWEEEEKERSSIPNPLGLSRDSFLCEEEDATQSTHSHCSVVSSTETRLGGPKEEEFVECRNKRTGQGKQREESSNGTSVSGNPEKNASHLTHHSSSSKQGVVWESDQAHAQPQARRQVQAEAGKRLHVYLEETNVIHGKDSSTREEVFRTKVTNNLKVLTKAKSLSSLNLPSSKSADNKRTNVKPAVEAESYYSSLVGVSLKSHKDTQLELDPVKEQTEPESMGRKNAARRKVKKNSQGDGGNTPQENTSPDTQPVPVGSPLSETSVTSPQGKSPKTHMGASSINSSSKHNPTSQASPEGGESQTSCPDKVKTLDNFQNLNSVTVGTLECAVVGNTDMEDDDSFYKIERKTETPESKRRSIKVSHSAVKFITKNVHINPAQSPMGEEQDYKPALKSIKDEEKEKPKETEKDTSLQEEEKNNKESKPVIGRIADKISLFEQKRVVGTRKQAFQTPRSADVSPARKATERLKAEFELSDKRSRSAERYTPTRSSSASPARERPMTVKERAKNFTQGSKTEAKPPAPTLKPTMTGMSKKSTSPTAVATSELDCQGKQDTKEHTTVMSEIRLKPDGRDTTTEEVDIPFVKQQSADCKTTDTVTTKTADQGTKAESDVTDKGAEDSSEMPTNLNKGPSRTGSRSKRRKGKDASGPLSPNSEIKPTRKADITNQEQVDDTVKTGPAAKQLTDKVSLSSDKAHGNISKTQSVPDTKQEAFTKEVKVIEKQSKQLDSLTNMKSSDKTVLTQDGSPEPSVNRDEPDTSAGNSGTKKPIDKSAVILPQKEEKEGEPGPVITQEKEKASKDIRETPASSPLTADLQTVEKTPSVEQQPPAKEPSGGVEKESLVQPESKSREKGKVKEYSKRDAEQKAQPQNKDTGLTNLSEGKNVEKTEKVGGETTNQTKKKDKEKPEQPLHLDKNATHGKVSNSGQGISEQNVAKTDERKTDETQLIKDIATPAAKQAQLASESPQKSSRSSDDLSIQTRHVSQAASPHSENDAICAVTQSNEAVSRAEGDKGPSEVEMVKNVPPELKKKSAESSGTETEPVVISAEPQPNSVSLEKTRNSTDESHSHGASDSDFSSSKHITKATTEVEEVNMKAVNDTPALITAQHGDTTEKKSSVKEPTPVSVSNSVSSHRAGQDDGKKSSTVKTVTEKSPGLLVKGAGEIVQSSSTSSTTLNVFDKTAEKTLSPPGKEPSLVANGDISQHPRLPSVEKEVVKNKTSQTPKLPISKEANKLISESIQRSSMKERHLPQGLSKDDSVKWQEGPSSWLDVDFKRKLKVPEPKLTSSGSESNLLDSGDLDDEDFVEKIKKLCTPFPHPIRKHNHLRPPQPPFAMPAIKEDRFEKTFDPEEFKFGLRKKSQFSTDTPPSIFAKLQSTETKSGLKPARASLADRSLLLGSLNSEFRLGDKTTVNDDVDAKGEKDDKVKMKSRLDGSCVLSNLTSTTIRGKKIGGTQAEGTSSGDASSSKPAQLSPPPSSQPSPPSLTASTPVKDALYKQSSSPGNREEAQAIEAVVGDSGPPLPYSNDSKLPDYLEKYLPREPVKPVQSTQGQDHASIKDIGSMTTPIPEGKADLAVKPVPALPDAAPPCFPVIHPTTQPAATEPPRAQPKGIFSNHIRTPKGFHKRPGKMVLFENAEFCGQAYEIYGDVADTTSLQFSSVISVKVVRGCWILYEKPDFQGRSIALEEGGIELTNVWAEPGVETEPHNLPPMKIGSVRLAVSDYTLPHIDLFTEPEGRGRVTPYHDDTIETGSFGIPLNTASIQVHSGVWLVFSDPGFQGMLAVLETGVYPFPETWGFPAPFVGSLRPLKMGGFKVENPNEVKAVVYEKPGFEGDCLEIDSEVFSFCENEGDVDSKNLKTVGSIKIIGGLWVGYNQPGFEGQQYILEEGEYLDSSYWGGSEQLLSLRPVLVDFMTPHLRMFSDRDFGKLGVNIDLTVPVINMDDTGYGVKTQSIDVIGGVWVVFEEPGFCGESYILEKGLYGSPEDWGALQPKIASAMPVILDDFENAAKFKVQLFSDPGFQGSVISVDDSLASLQDGFSVASCKVLAGSWLAFEGQDFTGKMYVLEMGNYPDLRAMGCDNSSSSILSLQTVGFEFSLPSITLFERSDLRGKRVVLTDGSVNLQLAGGCSRVQSVLVEGGMWVLYEGINYRGAQIFLKPGEILDWRTVCSWQRIGSLRPLIQKQVHFRIRNRQTGLMMTVTGDLDDIKMVRILEAEETDGLEQIWFYQNGHLHCKPLEECCLSPSGSMTMAGSRVGLTPELDDSTHLWSITPEGFIRYSPKPDLVLEVKGGHHYDKNQVILNTLDPHRPQQRWNVEII